MNRFALVSSRVCTPEGVCPAAVVIDGERISSVVDVTKLDDRIARRELGNLMVSPGVIDAHVHVNDPGSDWEGFETATKAAAAGGVTTIVDMPLNSLPVTTTAESLQKKFATARGRCWVDVGFHGGLIPSNGNNIEELIANGCVGIKAFLCHSGLNEFPNAMESDLRAALPLLKHHGIPLLVHAELVDESAPPLPAGTTSYNEYLNSRPEEWELQAIEMLIRLCEEFDSPIHIVHLSTQKASLMISDAKEAGLPLTVETCPHYLYFSAEKIPAGATKCKCAPPIRSNKNRLRLCQALTIDLIDTIGSDHSPSHPDLKALASGDFSKAWGGISGLQLSLPVVWTAGRMLQWTPNDLARWMSENSAKLIGLENRKGKIADGFDADIVVWDPESSFKVVAETLYHRHKISAYDGQELLGVVQQTYLRGECVFDLNSGLSREPMGQFVSRGTRPADKKDKPQFTFDEVSRFLNQLSVEQASETFEKCCAARKWVSAMTAALTYENDAALEFQSHSSWNQLDEESYLEAFAAHPRIGDVESLREKYANTGDWAKGEQVGAATATEATIQRLAQLNDEYFEKFGFIFIVCATGKTADEMLSILESRLPNDRETELSVAANEQIKITILRLRKLA